MAEFIDFLKHFGRCKMIGTISFIREKEGTRGKYLTLALEDGTKGLVVNDEKIMEAVKEGETYNFTVEKSGIFTIVTGIRAPSAGEKTDTYAEDVKTAEKLQKGTVPKQPQKPSPKEPIGSYKSDYMKKRTPEETEIIAKQAFAKSLIEAYARIWAVETKTFVNLDEFNCQVQKDANEYIKWLEIGKEK